MLDDLNLGADVLGTTQDARGVILVQTGDTIGKEVLSDNGEWWQHVGFCSRPALAKAGTSACQAIAIVQGSNDVCVASRDARCALPAGLSPGETMLYAGGPNNAGTAQVRLSDDGSTATILIQLKKGNASDGTPIKITLSSAGKITIDPGGGNSITLDEAGGIELGAGATLAVALEPALSSWIGNLLLSLASGSNSGGPVVFSVPLPAAPSIASTKVKAV